MNYLGDFRLGDTLDFKFTTRAFSSGAPTQLAGTPVVSAYPGNSTTQLTAGITLTVDFDTVTGLNNVRVVASSGNGYATATNYALVITTGTVGGVSVVGETVGHFSIENRSALMPSTATRTLNVAADGDIGGNVDGSVGSVTGAVGSVTGAVGSVTGNVGGNVTGSVGSVTGGINTGAGTITTLDGLDTAQDSQHSTTQGLIGTPSDFGSGASTIAANLQDMADNGTAVFDRSTDSLQAIRDHIGDGTSLTEAGGTGDQLTALATASALATAQADLDTLTGTDGVTLATSQPNYAPATAAALAVVDGIADDLKLGVILGSAQTGTLSTTQATTDLTGYADDQLIGRYITWTSGNCDGEQTDITDYANTGGLLTFTALTTAPANGDTFKIT